jgi:TctA family transporter
MDPIIQAAWDGLLLVFSWPNILYPVAGTLLAMTFAAMPGLSGVTLMAMAIPFTFSWDPLPVMLLFGALVGGSTFMGSVTAILLNIPGTGPNAATLIDGHPLARKGEAKTAIACSALSSALGSTFGILVLIVLIPVMRQSILAFGPPEFLMLAIWGMTAIAAATRGSLIRGLAAAGLGLLISFIGLDPRTAELRFTFGSLYLHDGVSLIPLFLGIFAMAEMIDLLVRGKGTISGMTRVEELTGRVADGFRAVFNHFGLFLRSSVIGTVIGIIPGMGGTVAGFVAYGQAVQTAGKKRDNFGRGDIRGVLAPEAANDSKDGASLVPTLAFGVPGSEGTALLLAALTLHGIIPGKELMTGNLHLVFVLIWSLFLANWLTSLLGMAMVNRLSWFTVVPIRWLAPLIFIMAALGAYVYKGKMGDVLVALGFGVLGYNMKKYRWPRICLVIAMVLGPLFEGNLHITAQLHGMGRINFWTRPIAMIILILTLISLALPFRGARSRETRREPK